MGRYLCVGLELDLDPIDVADFLTQLKVHERSGRPWDDHGEVDRIAKVTPALRRVKGTTDSVSEAHRFLVTDGTQQVKTEDARTLMPIPKTPLVRGME
jgi:hypothetical protein